MIALPYLIIVETENQVYLLPSFNLELSVTQKFDYCIIYVFVVSLSFSDEVEVIPYVASFEISQDLIQQTKDQ